MQHFVADNIIRMLQARKLSDVMFRVFVVRRISRPALAIALEYARHDILHLVGAPVVMHLSLCHLLIVVAAHTPRFSRQNVSLSTYAQIRACYSAAQGIDPLPKPEGPGTG